MKITTNVLRFISECELAYLNNDEPNRFDQ